MASRSAFLTIGASLILVAATANAVSMGPPSIALNLGLIAAYACWVGRGCGEGVEPAALLPVYLAAVALQCLHFCEEYLTGFQRDFPRLFAAEWSDRQFVVFNALWLAVFVLAGLGVYRRIGLAVIVVWFFALAGGVANGAAHLVLCVVTRRYFPGALTAPFVLLLGVILVRRLAAAGPPASAHAAAVSSTSR